MYSEHDIYSGNQPRWKVLTVFKYLLNAEVVVFNLVTKNCNVVAKAGKLVKLASENLDPRKPLCVITVIQTSDYSR